ncbi:MAG: dockerin type I domain-containing protein [Candidatus Poribacteria bacterium]|nr:dockerin type I domain-containing protein [Candidatus Poribacteria bacterium]MDE0503830.1 dockerin type I domain-containing protein [Candidatus Poribacteria bacterium]
MFYRHFISALMGTKHSLAIICLFTFIAGTHHASAQSRIAQDAFAIFQQNCLICHGPDGAFRETLLMEHDSLILGGSVVPGNPDASELYKRLLGPTENGARMPLGQQPLPPRSTGTIRNWILAGAPDWTTIPATNRPFFSPNQRLTSIESHLMSLEPFDRAFARYFTMTHLYNAGESSEILREYRNALSKLVNSLSWERNIINPQPIDPQATIYYIDLRRYEWDRNDAWTTIEAAYPYHISFQSTADQERRNQLGRLQRHCKSEVPAVHIDWFIATASTPPLYHELLALPTTLRELESRLEVDVANNLANAPGVRVWRAGFNNSGVSTNNRVVERHTSRYGAYWKSYDFVGSVGTRNIFTHPLSFTHDGGEVIFNLPNGLQGYYLVDASGFRLDEAPINIVSNPAASDPTVRNGISCIGCHTEGVKTLEDQVRSVIQSNANPPYDKAQALRLYVDKANMDVLVSEDMNRYREALKATGNIFRGVEPISRFHEVFQAPVDADYAAAAVGLETETFLQRVRENTRLHDVGLLVLHSESGSVQRDTWTSSFQDVMYALDHPGQVRESQVYTPPEVPRLQVAPDVNSDGAVDIRDLLLVVRRLGQSAQIREDVNGDSKVNVLDVALVAGLVDDVTSANPMYVDGMTMPRITDIKLWLEDSRQMGLPEPILVRSIQYFRNLLEVLTPHRTALLPNYPNPSNPETWIPYQLGRPKGVSISIYNSKGIMVRQRHLGLQPEGFYTHKYHAAYWDGRNQGGELVPSGVYYYTLSAGEFTATRKMLIRK